MNREAPEPTGDEPEDFVYEAPKIYEIVPPWSDLKEKLTNFMLNYNETVRGTGMDLVFFRDAMIHLMRVYSITVDICYNKLQSGLLIVSIFSSA